jgi:hypothetical protein
VTIPINATITLLHTPVSIPVPHPKLPRDYHSLDAEGQALSIAEAFGLSKIDADVMHMASKAANNICHVVRSVYGSEPTGYANADARFAIMLWGHAIANWGMSE